jgi:predicted enzyme related to lactoylglutathione lyase
MGERTRYAPGTFSWTDLTTPDQPAAKDFYAGLFGWTLQDMPAGEGAVYTMAFLDSRPVAAISAQPEQQRAAGTPPLWNSYVSVDDIKLSARRAGELGAHVHAGPFDVLDAGRMAVVQDPQGAFFMLWQAGGHPGAGLVNVPGALAWNELGTPDPGAAARFYADLLGWTANPMEGSDPPYLVISTADGRPNGGIRPPAQPEAPPAWLVYFACGDLTDSLDHAGQLGGHVLVGQTDIGTARIGVVQDPQGAVFALYEGQLDD